MADREPQAAGRRDTRLRTEGAEFLVLAHLLMNDIQASKAYVRFPGYYIIGTDADYGTSVRIEVKSRSDTYEARVPHHERRTLAYEEATRRRAIMLTAIRSARQKGAEAAAATS